MDGQDPERPPQSASARRLTPSVWLALALVLSAASNAVLSVRAQDARDRAARAEATADDLQRRLDALTADARAPGGGGPFADLSRAVEKLRALTFVKAVEPRLLSRAELVAEITEGFEADTDAEELRASGRVLAAFGLLAEDADLYQIVKEATTSQVAGFFDQRDGDLVALAEDAKSPSPFTRVALAHELTHALTAQRFDTDRMEELDAQRRDDESFAYLSLLEGDATWVMQEYARTILTAEEQAAYSAEGLGFIDGGATVPGFLEDIFAFPYVEGASFVAAVRERGGPSLLDRAYRDPPVSTEQIIHPAKYLDERDDPVEITTADLARGLGDGWKRLDRGGFGEVDVRMVLDGDDAHPFLSTSDARAAAAGWDGGAYTAATSATGVVVGVVTAWDASREATEAARAFGRWLPARFARVGVPFEVAGDDGRGWDAGAAGAGVVVRRGDRVIVVVGDRRDDVVRALRILRD